MPDLSPVVYHLDRQIRKMLPGLQYAIKWKKAYYGYGFAALVMTRTKDGWRAAADIVGVEPSAPPSGQPGPVKE